MNDLPVMAKFDSRGDVERPFDDLFDIKFSFQTSVTQNSVPKISIRAMLHDQVVMVALHFVIQVAKKTVKIRPRQLSQLG